MQAIFYQFAKDTKSTALPTSEGVALDVVLKSDTSLDTPVLKISGFNSTIYNYCKWNNRYYFIEDVVYINNAMYELHCRIDVLATYRADIMNSSQYVLRSESKWNTAINDSYYPATAKQSVRIQTTADTGAPFYWYTNFHHYVIGVTGACDNSAYSNGSTTYYLIDAGNFKKLLDYLLGDVNYFNLDDFNYQIVKSYVNPMQYIVSCVGYSNSFGDSFNPDEYGREQNFIKFGFYTIVPDNFTCYALANGASSITNELEFDATDHPQAVGRGYNKQTQDKSYLNLFPYSERTLTFYPFGVLNLDSIKFDKTNKLRFRIVTNLTDGEALLFCYVDSDREKQVGQWLSKIGFDIPITQLSTNFEGLAFSTIQATIGLANVGTGLLNDSAGTAGAGSSMLQGGVIGVINASQPETKTLGGRSSQLCRYFRPFLTERFTYVVDEDLTENGRPLCEIVQLSELSGYCKCLNPKIKITGANSHNEAICSALASGLRLE